MQTRDVAVFREEHVAALATEVHARLGNGKRVARDVATDDEREAPDVALGRAAEPLDSVCRRGLGDERLEADDLLPDAEHVARAELDGDLGRELEERAVQAALVLNAQAARPDGERRVAGREVAVTREDAARVATERDDALEAERADLALVRPERGEDRDRTHARRGRGRDRRRRRRWRGGHGRQVVAARHAEPDAGRVLVGALRTGRARGRRWRRGWRCSARRRRRDRGGRGRRGHGRWLWRRERIGHRRRRLRGLHPLRRRVARVELLGRRVARQLRPAAEAELVVVLVFLPALRTGDHRHPPWDDIRTVSSNRATADSII